MILDYVGDRFAQCPSFSVAVDVMYEFAGYP